MYIYIEREREGEIPPPPPFSSSPYFSRGPSATYFQRRSEAKKQIHKKEYNVFYKLYNTNNKNKYYKTNKRGRIKKQKM